MIVPLASTLDGIAAERFVSLARALGRTSAVLTDADCRRRLDQELTWCRDNPGLNGSQLAYEASIRVLLDVVRLGWKVREEGYGIELISEKTPDSGLNPQEILDEKNRTRAAFRPVVDSQFRDPSVRAFVESMEEPTASSRKKPVTLLIADGEEVHTRLILARSSDEKPPNAAIQPYLQLVTADAIDEFTGHNLREIWRYFRYSWSIPQFATPGRQLLYLVRDAAHPCHAVMGIIGLNNCALQMGAVRETHLGWNFESVTERLESLSQTAPEGLAREIDWMEEQIAAALNDVAWSGLVSPSEVESPHPEMISKLRRRAKEFDRLRDETLREFASSRSGSEMPTYLGEQENLEYGHPPVAEEMLNLEGKPGTRPEVQKARRHLVARKRAALLAELLQARLTIRSHRPNLLNPRTCLITLQTQEVQVAVNTVLAALKSRHAGINMLEISTCGAIPPYNHLLGGKLASLLLFSPQIAADYRRIYEGPSIIASQMKNQAVRRPNELVYLGTTSLYAQGSSQYERLKLPAGTIAPDQPELAFRKLGATSGYGTLQFPPETRGAVERHLESVQEFKDINSIFGEGPSPKFRKLVAGLRAIGFPPTALMRHNCPRLIYSVPLFPGAGDYLNSRPCAIPSYVAEPEKFTDASSRIIDFWKSRWLASRLRHQPSVLALLGAPSWKLSDKLSVERENRQPSAPSATRQRKPPTLWHQLAAAGPQVTSDVLSPADLARLHVIQPVEDFIREKVAAGFSVFLTGNAGDGKTHLLRRLKDDLSAANAEVVEDATALMRENDLSPVLDRWRKAVADRRPFCIAINEFPLYLLRREAKAHLPELVAEISRQIESRLAYGSPAPEEDADHAVLVIDLSLRNPLRRDFASACLEKMLSDEDLLQSAADEPSLAWNLKRLADPQVRERLFLLFERLAALGVRATVRELWIVLARLVTGYRADLPEPLGEGMAHWYSEVLFQTDPRFALFAALVACDPAGISHPVWDARIEEADPGLLPGWFHGVPRPQAAVRLGRKEFFALKRAFYLEHSDGEKCLELESSDLATFRRLLADHSDGDPVARGRLVEAVNRAYSPVSFAGIADSLFLWNGHRFHEQPSEAFVANRRIPADRLELTKARMPGRLREAFPDYFPDHLALLRRGEYPAALRIDAELYQTLMRLRGGLPRKLLAESATFRLEAFLDHLHRGAPPPERQVFSAHLKRRELLVIQMSSANLEQNIQYEQIRRA